jgi:GDP-L-fucose synthase
MKALILGSDGFLGTWVARKLKDLKPDMEIAGASLSKGIDLRERRQAFDLFKRTKPAYVINCAAHVGGVQYGHVYPAEMYYNNMQMVLNIFEACKNFKVKRLMQPISNCAYPVNENFFQEERLWNGPLDESVLAYGATRRMMWVGAWAYAKQFRLDTVSLILSNMYGPGEHFDEMRSHALGAILKKIVDAKIKKEREVVIWGTGDPIREWLYVEDGAEALVKAMDIKPHNDIINIGVGKGISVRDLALLIKETVGWDGKFIYDTSKIDGAPCKIVDGTKGAKLLRWKPQVSLKDGIKKTVEYYLEKECGS